MAAMLILIGRLTFVESPDGGVAAIRPTNTALDHVAAILDLTL
jgi:hypothetical protein